MACLRIDMLLQEEEEDPSTSTRTSAADGMRSALRRLARATRRRELQRWTEEQGAEAEDVTEEEQPVTELSLEEQLGRAESSLSSEPRAPIMPTLLFSLPTSRRPQLSLASSRCSWTAWVECF